MASFKSKILNMLVCKSKTLKKGKKLSIRKASTKSKKRLTQTSNRRLPSSLLKKIDHGKWNNSESEANKEEGNDFYEYKETILNEEPKRSRNCDPVENHKSKMAEGIEGEDTESDADDEQLKMLEGINEAQWEALYEKKLKLPQCWINGKVGTVELLDSPFGNSDHNKRREKPEIPFSKIIRTGRESWALVTDPYQSLIIWRSENWRAENYDEEEEWNPEAVKNAAKHTETM